MTINPFQQFVSTTNGYHPENAYALSEASVLAYEHESQITHTALSWGFNDVSFISKKETQLFIASNQSIVIISFRGTEPDKVQDWKTDIKFRSKEGPFGARVHRGFRDALDCVWDELILALNTHQNNQQSLWITGHSLGGALAILCTAYLRDIDSNETTVNCRTVNGTYTFGCPRVGKSDFVKAINTDNGIEIFQFINNNDAVTRVPPWSVGYRHTGQYLYFSEDGATLKVSPSFGYRVREFFSGVWNDVGQLGPDALRDHSKEDYRHRTYLHRNRNPFND